MAEPTSKAIREKINELEIALTRAALALDGKKSALASAHATGGDTAAAAKALTAARDDYEAVVAALEALDRQWYEAALAERNTAVAALMKERDQSFQSAGAEVKKAFDSITPTLKKYLPKAVEYVAEVYESCTSTLWEQVTATYREGFIALGDEPQPLPSRDEQGIPKKVA